MASFETLRLNRLALCKANVHKRFSFAHAACDSSRAFCDVRELNSSVTFKTVEERRHLGQSKKGDIYDSRGKKTFTTVAKRSVYLLDSFFLFLFSGTNHKVDQRVERLFALLSLFCPLLSLEQLFVYIIVFKRNDLTCEHWNYGQRKGRQMSMGMLVGVLI